METDGGAAPRSPADIAASMPGWQPPGAKAAAFHLKDNAFPKKRVSPENQHVMEQLRWLIERELFTWELFPIELPPTVFNDSPDAENGGYKQDAYFFQVPSLEETPEKLAFNADGSQKKLSRDQLRQVWRTATFDVPSEVMPDQPHVWQLSGLLVRGKDNITARWRKLMSIALQNIVQGIPNRIVGNRWSVKQGLKSLMYGPRDLLAQTIGLVEQVPKYSEYEIAEMLIREQKRYMLAESQPGMSDGGSQAVPQGAKRQPSHGRLPQSAETDYLDYRLSTDQFMTCLSREFSAITRSIFDQWDLEKHAWERQTKEELAQRGVSDEKQQKQTVVNLAVEEKISRLYTAILSSGELERISPGIGRICVNYLKALRIVRGSEAEQDRKEMEKRNQVIAELQKKHSFRSRWPGWLSSRADSAIAAWVKQEREKMDESILAQLKDANLLQEAYLFERGCEFRDETWPKRDKELSSLRSPARIWRFERLIWLPKNWIIEKHTDVSTGEDYYTCRQSEIHQTRSDVFGYRFWNMYEWTIAAWKGGLFGLFWNLWSGPLSLRALFLPRPYFAAKMLDSKTGKIVDAPWSETLTFATRIRALWSHIRKSRAAFEREPDTGFIGKTVSRIFNVIWNYGVKGLLGTAVVGIGQPALSIVSVLLSLILIVTSFVWAPISAVLRWSICFLFYDFDFALYGSRSSPFVFIVIWRILLLGLGNIASSLAGAALYHPIVALLISLYGSATAGARLFYDAFMYAVVIWPRARIPASNSFLAKRVSGPGMASEVFVQLEPADVLTALQCTLEKLELDLWQSRMIQAINKPIARLENHPLRDAFEPAALTFASHSDQFKSIRQKVNALINDLNRIYSARLRQLPNIPSGSMVRLSRGALKTVRTRGEVLVRQFITEHIVPISSKHEMQQMWAHNWSLEQDDWAGLTDRLLTNTFSYGILTPLEESDRTVKLKVRKFKFRSMVVDADVYDPLEQTTAEVSIEYDTISPTVPDLSASDLLSCGRESGRSSLIAPLLRDCAFTDLYDLKEDEK